VIGVDGWLDESSDVGVEPASRSAPPVTGICGSGIIDVVAEMFLAGIVDADGTIDGALAATSSRIVADGRTFAYVLWHDAQSGPIMIRQNDVRAIQLAKAALRAGVDLLIEHAGHPPIGGVALAGAFGAHIDPLRAMVLGIIPDCPLEAVRSVGNAAGTGAVQMLLSRSLRSENERVVADVVKIETATEPRFQELFVEAMAFPHATAAAPHLAEHVDVPQRRPRAQRRRRGTTR
jgi:uncharacterized 2Fe-2S/4Fe-4S cluster protein (DUF4445 family)